MKLPRGNLAQNALAINGLATEARRIMRRLKRLARSVPPTGSKRRPARAAGPVATWQHFTENAKSGLVATWQLRPGRRLLGRYPRLDFSGQSGCLHHKARLRRAT